MKSFVVGIIGLLSLMILTTSSLAADKPLSEEQASKEVCKKICQGVIDGLNQVTGSKEKVDIVDCYSDMSDESKRSIKLECEVVDEKLGKEKVTLIIENMN